MSVTVDDVLSYVGANSDDYDRCDKALDDARMMVARFVGSAVVPENIKDRAVLEAAHALFVRQDTATGQIGRTYDGGMAFAPKDPMNRVYPLLRPYVLPF